MLYVIQRLPLRLGLGQGGAGAVYNRLKPLAIFDINHVVINCLQQLSAQCSKVSH